MPTPSSCPPPPPPPPLTKSSLCMRSDAIALVDDVDVADAAAVVASRSRRLLHWLFANFYDAVTNDNVRVFYFNFLLSINIIIFFLYFLF